MKFYVVSNERCRMYNLYRNTTTNVKNITNFTCISNTHENINTGVMESSPNDIPNDYLD